MKLGDTVAAVTEFFGIEPCEACKKRQEKLNNLSDWLSDVFSWKKDESNGMEGSSRSLDARAVGDGETADRGGEEKPSHTTP